MIEIALFLLIVVPAIGVRAQQRGVSKTPYVVAMIAGFSLFVAAGFLGLGTVAVILRWLWVGVVFLVVEFLSSGGRKGSGTWQCSNCRMFNDLRTLRCMCGTPYEATPPSTTDSQ